MFLAYIVYSDDKIIKAGVDLALHQLIVYKLMDGNYELFQTIKSDIGVPSNLAISGNGKVIMVAKNNARCIGIVYVYEQRGSEYVFVRSIYSDEPRIEDGFGNHIELDYEGNIINIR